MQIRKTLSLILAAAVFLSLSGCVPFLPGSTPSPDTAPSTLTPLPSRPPLEPEDGHYRVDQATGTLIAGDWITALRPEGSSGSVTYNDTYAGGNGRD